MIPDAGVEELVASGAEQTVFDARQSQHAFGTVRYLGLARMPPSLSGQSIAAVPCTAELSWGGACGCSTAYVFVIEDPTDRKTAPSRRHNVRSGQDPTRVRPVGYAASRWIRTSRAS